MAEFILLLLRIRYFYSRFSVAVRRESGYNIRGSCEFIFSQGEVTCEKNRA